MELLSLARHLPHTAKKGCCNPAKVFSVAILSAFQKENEKKKLVLDMSHFCGRYRWLGGIGILKTIKLYHSFVVL